MAINKKLIHFEEFSNFNSMKLSANKENTQYTIGISDTIYDLEEGKSVDILYQSIVYIKDTQQQWTHGQIYNDTLVIDIGSLEQGDTWDGHTFEGSLNDIEGLSFNIIKNAILNHKQIIFNWDNLYNITYSSYDDSSLLVGFVLSDGQVDVQIALDVNEEEEYQLYLREGFNITVSGFLNIKDTSSILSAQTQLMNDGESVTYVISNSYNYNYPTPLDSKDTIYIDTQDLHKALFYTCNGSKNTLINLLKNGEVYYRYLNSYSSKNIKQWIKAELPKFDLLTTRVGDLITITRHDYDAEEFYSKYIDFNSINLGMNSMQQIGFNSYLASLGITANNNGDAIKQLLINGYFSSAAENPVDYPNTEICPLAVDGKVIYYTADITPNTQNIYSGKFWTGNMTGPGIYSYVDNPDPNIPDREEGEMYTGYVSPDGTQTLVSMKDPSRAFTRANIGDSWTKLTFGAGKKVEGTGEIFNDYINNRAHPDHAHAEGQSCRAEGWNSHAEGFQTTAGKFNETGNAHSEGNNTWAAGNNSHAEGVNTVAEGHNSHAEGDSTVASNWNAHAEGYRTIASGNGAHAEGNSDGFEKDRWNIASGFAAHTEGGGTVASGDYTHAEGRNTTASGLASHAEGRSTQAVHNDAHAEGFQTYANCPQSHAEGSCNYYEGLPQWKHAVGIGYGTANAQNPNSPPERKNAHLILDDGRHYIYGIGGYEGKGIENATDLATSLNNLITVTYSELKTIRNESRLVTGKQYRITDYITTTTEENTKSANHQFDIIVTATSENTLNSLARAVPHEGDTYFSSCDLSMWQLWYNLDNDTVKYGWADENGKGVIYRMIDEHNNDCPYDFKNIMFYTDKYTENTTEDNYYYTFSYVDGNLYDYSTYAFQDGYASCKENRIMRYSDGKQQLNHIIFRNTDASDYCNSNIFGIDCFNNIFGASCEGNTFDMLCQGNVFGDYYFSNQFGILCKDNKFGNECEYNNLGGYFERNVIGNNCKSNTFKQGCSVNTLGNYCEYNIFGNNCCVNSFQNYYKNIELENDCSYINFVSSSTTSSSNYLQNVRVTNALRGTYSSKLNITITPKSHRNIIVTKDGSGKVVQYFEQSLEGYATETFVTTAIAEAELNDKDIDISGKQDTILDLESIRSGAALGATALQSYTETDPIFAASPAATIKTSDINKWNLNTPNVGTITGIKMNNTSKGTSGTVDLGTVITGIKMNNASKTVNNGVVDLGTVITSHQDISGKANVNHTHTKSQITDFPTKLSQFTNDLNFTSNVGTVTEVKMNGVSKGKSGSVDLGNVVTSVKFNGSTKTPSNGLVDLGSTAFNEFTITKTDYSSSPDWVLIADITDLQSKTEGGNTYGFTGIFNSHRDAGYVSEETGFIIAKAYWSKDLWVIKSTGKLVTPYIVRYDPNIDLEAGEVPNKYWIALKISGSNKQVNFIGDKMNLLDEFIHLKAINTEIPPEGIVVVSQPEDYILSGIGVNVQAVEAVTAVHSIESNTCLKYTEQALTDEQKDRSRINIGLDNLYNWHQSIPINTLTGYQKHLIGAGSYPIKQISGSNNIDPNAFYDFKSVSGPLTVILNPPTETDITNEYMFQFKAISDDVELMINTITWNKPLTIKNGYTYQISIMNNLATYLEFEV